MVEDPRDDILIRAIQQHVDQSIQQLAGTSGQRYDEIQAGYAQIQEQITALSGRFTTIEARLNEIEGRAGQRFDQIDVKAGVNIEIARLLVANSGAGDAGDADALIPGPGSPRPAAIDRACAADEPTLTIVPEYGLEIEPEPGSDPAEVWSTAQRLIEAECDDGAEQRRR